jgi:hypothetical protein
MKYVVTLVLGFFVGVVLFAIGMLYNPFVADRGLSPLSVTDAEVLTLTYSVVPAETIMYTNDGESLQTPFPPRVPQLWEAPIRQTDAMVSLLHDASGNPAGLGVKFSSKSENTHLFGGKALKDSAWYVYLPERGSLFIHQTENYWLFLQQIGFPAWRSSGNNWRGSWLGDLTAGPGALGTAAAVGSSGEFAGLEMEAVESLSVRAFSTDTGFVSAEGRLLIELPRALPDDELTPAPVD